VIDAFVDELGLQRLGFLGTEPATTGRPSYHPAVLLKIYIYGYLNRIQSSRRLERESQRSVELMWLTGHLAPDFKTIADFRHDNGKGIRNACRRFVELCRELKLSTQATVAIDGSKFKAVNTRDRNFTLGKVKKRQEQIEESIHRYLTALDTADRPLPAAEFQAKAQHLKRSWRRCESKCVACTASSVSFVDDVVCDDQVVLGFHGDLNVVPDDARPAATGCHRPRIAVGQRQLAVRLHGQAPLSMERKAS
jgi:transposase